MSVHDRSNLRSVYLYLVCLVTLVMVIFSAVSLVRNVVELAYPDPGSYAFEPAFGPEGAKQTPEERQAQQEAMQDSQRRQAVLGLVGSATMLGMAGPAYLYHWRRVQAELRAGDEDVARSGL